MALTDIVTLVGDYRVDVEIPQDSLGTVLDILEVQSDVGRRNSLVLTAVYPAPEDVKLGVHYGPTGNEFVGVYLPPTVSRARIIGAT